MDMRTVAARDFWHKALVGRGFTGIPRGVREPVPGLAHYQTTIPEQTVAPLRHLGYQLELPLRAVVLTAHAKVLAALSGEREVVTGYVAGPGRRPLPCRLTLEPPSWREVVQETRRVETDIRAHADFPVDDLRRELGRTDPLFETVFDPTGTEDAFADDALLEVALRRRGNQHVLRLRYRIEALDAATAARIAGYHLTALSFMAAHPDGEHGRQSPLSPGELLPTRTACRAPPHAARPSSPRTIRGTGPATPGEGRRGAG
jgi:non-ribosomal peptide synthetase component F